MQALLKEAERLDVDVTLRDSLLELMERARSWMAETKKFLSKVSTRPLSSSNPGPGLELSAVFSVILRQFSEKIALELLAHRF